MSNRDILSIETAGRGLYDITRQVSGVVDAGGVRDGQCHCFIKHTSSSLIITENADPQVHRDLENFLARLVPDGDPLFGHDAEGPDDMPAHVRTVLTATELTVPVADGRLALGTWQGLYLYEHRARPHTRRVIVTVTPI